MRNWKKIIVLWSLIIFLFIATSCAPGNKKFEARPAGFWAGLWHGLICIITFIISLFTDRVSMYEVSNSGGWYNFGFLIGAAIALGGSWAPYKKKKAKSAKEKEWKEIGAKVEEKVCKAIKDWVDESEQKDEEWEEIGKKIEEKIKRELRKWAEN